MASIGTFEKCILQNARCFLKPYCQTKRPLVVLPLPISRRSAIFTFVLPLSLIALPQVLLARERRNKKIIPLEDYLTSPDGLKYYDVVEGKGPVAEKGSTAQVHFDCMYRGITVVSSRESKLLAGNRIIAQPYEFQVGAAPGKERKREFVDNPNGLFSAQAAPKPPKAMYTITEGMKVGGKRTVIIPPEAGYGPMGMNEIPISTTPLYGLPFRVLSGANSPPPQRAAPEDSSIATVKAVNSDLVVILATLLCALICVLGLVIVSRCTWIRRICGVTVVTPPAAAQPPRAANRGLKKVLRSLPKLTYGEEDEYAGKLADDCAICLEEFAAGEEIRVLPQCGHGFHVGCIDMWLGSHSSCPSCRQIFVAARCHNCGSLPVAASSGAPPEHG